MRRFLFVIISVAAIARGNGLFDADKVIFQALAAETGDGRATVSRSVDHSFGVAAEMFTVQPAREESARVMIYVLPGSSMSVSIGENSSLEIRDARPRDDNERLLSEVLRAVALGQFEETVWTRDGQIVRSIGRLRLGRSVLTLRKRNSWESWLPSARRVISYSPY